MKFSLFLSKFKKYIGLKGLILIFLVAVVFGVTYLVKRPVSKTKISAATGIVTVRIQPESVTLPQQKIVQVWATVDRPVGFIDLDITFDKSKLEITKEPNFSVNSTNIISMTNMATANTSGRITFIAGVDPTKISTAPNGTFQIGSIEFINTQVFTDGATTIDIQTSESQFVDMDATPFRISGINATVTLLNSTNTSTPTPTGTAVPTPTGTTVPSPTGTAVPSPTINPTISASPTPIVYPAWDINQDGLVNIIDIGLVIDKYGDQNPINSRADVNNDGKVDMIDIGIVIDHYGEAQSSTSTSQSKLASIIF